MGVQLQQGVTGSRSKEGLVKINVPWFVDTLAECFTVGDLVVLGLPQTDRDFNERQGGEQPGFDVKISYEGISGEPSEKESYEWAGSFSREPIETHEKINDLIAKYGGRIGSDGKVIWDPTLPDGAETDLGLGQGADAETTEKNPMFGNDTFLSLGVIFRRTRILRTVPVSVIANIGKITKTIPGGFPTPDGRNWLIMPPRISQKGNAYELGDEFMLSAPGGWPEPIHELIVT